MITEVTETTLKNILDTLNSINNNIVLVNKKLDIILNDNVKDTNYPNSKVLKWVKTLKEK